MNRSKKITSIQKKCRDSSIGAAVDTSNWEVTLGTGMTATAVNVACITTGAAVYVNLQGYIAQ